MTKRRVTFLLLAAALACAAALAWLGVPPQRANVTPPALVPQEWAKVHDSPGHAAHVGKQNLACSTCHDESDGGFRSMREASCTNCHGVQVSHHHQGNAANPTPCLTCHSFKSEASPTCLSCHEKRQGPRAALEVHVGSGAPCLTCHAPHGDGDGGAADCSKCHQETARHGTLQVSTNSSTPAMARDAGVEAAKGTCTDCHAPHAHASQARGSCQACHTSAPQSARPSAHPACVTCHVPHDLTRAAVRPCATCHDDKHAAVTANHAACQTCHTPHATQNAKGACATCHAEQKTLGAPTVAAHTACVNCHEPHAPNASPDHACASCHSSITPHHAPGGPNSCSTCHTMHPKAGATPAAVAKPCTTCHAQARSDVTGHTKGLGCTSCHEAHAFDLGRPTAALCTSCHAPETKVASANKGHRDCVQCHSAVHEPQREKPCATCHAAEAASAPPGHQACQACHQAHDGHLKPTATCQSCHREEASSKHAHVVGGCATCHKPHGPTEAGATLAAPACGSCHAATKLPGLHRLLGKSPTGHQQCSSCHSSHQAPRDDRATCTTCHKDRVNHEPTATGCKGCHIFRRP